MEDNFFTDIIGIGATYPIQIQKNELGETGWYPINGSLELIKNNISSILYYMIGQRFRQENFGNRLMECIEEQNTQALSFIIKEFIKTSIGTWEHRILLKRILVERINHKINIEVNYVLKEDNQNNQYLNISYDSLDNSLKSY